MFVNKTIKSKNKHANMYFFFILSSVDDKGRKKTLSVTQQCCKGFGRKKNSKSANIFMPCEELHLRSLIETSERLNGREFIRSAQKNDVDDELRKNVTLFLPTDATFTEFAEQLLESVCINCLPFVNRSYIKHFHCIEF